MILIIPFVTHLWYRLYQQTCPVVFELIPQAIAGIGKVPCPSLYEEAIFYLPLKQKVVEDFILPVICNPCIFSDSIKIVILIVWCFKIRFPKYLF